MKHFKIVAILLLSSFTLFYSCKEETEVAKEDTNTLNETTNPVDFLNSISTSNAVAPPQANSEPAQNATGVWHYTCAKGCAGGAGSAVNCTTCGNPLQHNQAYHGNVTNTPTKAPITTPNTQTSTTIPAPQPEPAQNAAGVWHYTCEKGCAGGSGAPEACKSCGTTLAHNATYHK
jgi:hypothetical protein